MRVMVLANFDVGLYKLRGELLHSLCQKHEVDVVLPKGECTEALQALGCNFIDVSFNRRGTNPIADLGQIARYKKIIKERKPDVILTYTIKPNVYGGYAARCKKVPYIANITGMGTAVENGGLLGLISTRLYAIGLKGAEVVFFQNSGNEAFFKSKHLVKGRTRLIPGSGVNLTQHCLEEYPEETNETKFLFIGRVMKDKGIDELFEATKILHEKYPNISLDVVGGMDEDYSSKIESYCSEGYIRYHGTQPETHSFIKESHCVVLPSYHEGMSNSLLEAAASGRPIVATNVPGCQETFDEGVTGYGCTVKDTASLVSAMEKIINLSREERREMGLNGRKKVEREFDRKLVIEAYEEEINKIFAGEKQK